MLIRWLLAFATFRRVAGGLSALLCWTAALVMPAAGQTISVGAVSGKPGWLVTVNAALSTGQPVEGTQNDIIFDSSKTPIAAKTDGTPDCSVNPGINKQGSFAFRPNGCWPGECSKVRAAIWTKDGFAGIPNGSTLYSCKVQIATTAPAGIYPLANSGVAASDASGNALSATGTNGQVQVTGGCQIQPHNGGPALNLAWLAAFALVVRQRRRLRRRRPRPLPRYCAAAAGLVLVVGAAGLTPAPAHATTAVRTDGTWQRTDGVLSGQWEAELGVAASGKVSGHLKLPGLATFDRANVAGALAAERLTLTLLAVDTNENLGTFAATIDAAAVAGSLTTSGAVATLAGQWLPRAPVAEIPQAILDGLAAGKPQDIAVKFKSRAVEAQAASMRLQAGLEADDAAILDFKAAEFAAMKTRVLSAMPSGEVTVLREYSHLPTTFVRVSTLNALSALLAQPEVVRVHEDVVYDLQLAQSLPLVRQPESYAAGFGGAGTTVAVLDTGLDPNALPPFTFGNCGPNGELIGNAGCSVVFAQDFTAVNDGALDDDVNHHGTHVSGIVHGVAPGAGIAALDVFTLPLGAAFQHIAAAMNWVIANRAAYNIVAINMSLGLPATSTAICLTSELTEEIATAREAGILSVIASGNNADPDRISDPACAPLAVRVGATYDANVGMQAFGVCTDPATAADQVTCFSNSAFFLTAMAPGCAIIVGGLTLCGTSMAAPHGAGATALLRAPGAFPLDEPDCTLRRLVSPGVDLVDPRNGLQFPRLDAFGSVSTLPNSVCDCNGNGAVTISELIRGVNIAFGSQPLSACPSADANGDGLVSLPELVAAARIMVSGCRVT